jgi:cytidylate kinase
LPVITISRQLGSLGNQIARATAELLGYRLVWRDLINEAALRAGAPGTALAVIDELGLLGISLSKKEIRAYRKALKQVMKELYSAGNAVIVGRAGQIILHDQPAVLHVRVVAPAELRAQRIAASKIFP